MDTIKILKEPTNDKPFIIIDKPKGLPTAPLSSTDENNALFQAEKLFPEIKNVVGKKEIEHGLIHRIDTITDGLVLIATTQEAYNYLIDLQYQDKIIKTYKANCIFDLNNKDILEGFPNQETLNFNLINSFTTESYFRPFGPGKKEVRPVTKDSGAAALKKLGKPKLYSTTVKIISKQNNIVSVECEISNGYRHQVRCHLAWNDLPIINEAMVAYMTKGISVEETVNNCNDLIKFQKIVKVSSKYLCGWHNRKKLTDKTFRVFASKDNTDTYIGKQKSEGSTIEKFANTPDHCFIDNTNVNEKKVPDKLDRQWYIDLANERLKQYGVK